MPGVDRCAHAASHGRAVNVPARDALFLTLFAAGRNVERGVNVCIMKRRLVLTNEAARHPFRRMLPPPVIAAPRASDDHDLKLFALSFTAFFVCFYSFIF